MKRVILIRRVLMWQLIDILRVVRKGRVTDILLSVHSPGDLLAFKTIYPRMFFSNFKVTRL